MGSLSWTQVDVLDAGTAFGRVPMEQSDAKTVCSDDVVKHALELLKEALQGYLRANCKRVVSMAKLAGQSRVRIELYGPFRYFTSTEEFPRFTDALNTIIECMGIESVCRALGCIDFSRHSEDDRLWYLVYEVSKLEELCRDIEAL